MVSLGQPILLGDRDTSADIATRFFLAVFFNYCWQTFFSRPLAMRNQKGIKSGENITPSGRRFLIYK